MRGQPGFQSFELNVDGDFYVIKSSWATIPEWEAFNLTPEARRSHLPVGVWQFVPARGEGFPEDFVPFYDMNKAVDAKY